MTSGPRDHAVPKNRAGPENCAGTENCAVLKIGGSIATVDRTADPVNRDLLRRLAAELKTIARPLVLVHGTGHVGKPWAHKGGLTRTGHLPPAARDVALRIKAELRLLNAGVVTSLHDGGLPVMGVDYESLLRLGDDGARAFLFDRLERGIVPVFFGDMLEDEHGGFDVVSSDVMLLRIVDLVAATTAIFLTDVEGVLGGDPESRLDTVSPASIEQVARRSSDDHDVSAGMRGKLSSAFLVAAKVERCYIASGLDPTNASRLLLGTAAPATRILAETKA